MSDDASENDSMPGEAATAGTAATAADDAPSAADAPASATSRPLVERLGLAAIALVLAAVFGFVCLAAWTSGEVFLAVMAGIGALMTIWAAAATVRRG